MIPSHVALARWPWPLQVVVGGGGRGTPSAQRSAHRLQLSQINEALSCRQDSQHFERCHRFVFLTSKDLQRVLILKPICGLDASVFCMLSLSPTETESGADTHFMKMCTQALYVSHVTEGAPRSGNRTWCPPNPLLIPPGPNSPFS